MYTKLPDVKCPGPNTGRLLKPGVRVSPATLLISGDGRHRIKQLGATELKLRLVLALAS
jgi:hypothetical protein